jgi:DNA-binding response OmpR family regulator
MRILLVEDSERLRRSLAELFRGAGFAIDMTGDGEEGWWYAEQTNYDVIVLDIMLPGLDGLSLLQRLRDCGKTTHVLLLTARDGMDDRVKGLRLGADDYLVKPFATEELLARVQALCRRAYGLKKAIINIGPLSIDLSLRKATLADAELALKPREFRILEYLALRRDQVVSRMEIERHLYNEEREIASNAVNSAISVLRKHLESGGHAELIQTLRGHGYLLSSCSDAIH